MKKLSAQYMWLLIAACLLAIAVTSANAQSYFQAGRIISDVLTTPVNVPLANGQGFYTANFWLRPFDSEDDIEQITIVPDTSSSANVLTGFDVSWIRDTTTFGFTLFNISAQFYFEFLPGYAMWRFDIITTKNVYESEINLLPFNVFGFTILQPGTDPNQPGSPEDNKIVLGASSSWSPGNYQAILQQPDQKYVFPLIGHFTSQITRFPYDMLLAAIRPSAGGVFYDQVDWNPMICQLAYIGYVGDQYELEDGCGFAFFIKENANEDVFVMKVNPYRTLDWLVDFGTDELIEVDGESYETTLHADINNTPVPPTIVEGDYDLVLNRFGGQIVPFSMSNVFSPPRPANDIMIGGTMVVLNPASTNTEFRINMSYTDSTPAASYMVFVQNINEISASLASDKDFNITMTAQYSQTGSRSIVFLGRATVQVSGSQLCQPDPVDTSNPGMSLVEFSVDFLRYGPDEVSEYVCDSLIDVVQSKFPQFGRMGIRFVGSRISRQVVSRAAGRQTSGSTVVVVGEVPTEEARGIAEAVDQFTSSEEFATDMHMDPSWVDTGVPAEVVEGSTPTGSARPTATGTGTPSASPTRSQTPNPTPSRSPSASPTATRTGTPSASPTRSHTPNPTSSRSPSDSPTATRTGTPSVFPTVPQTQIPTSSRGPSGSPTRTAPPRSSSPTPSYTITESFVPSVSPSTNPTPVEFSETPEPDSEIPVPDSESPVATMETASSAPDITSSVSPDPTATSGSDSVCFPADAWVTMEDGNSRRMDELEIGDRVLVGSGTYSDVYFFGHRVPASQGLFSFIRLNLEAGKYIELSEGHLVLALNKGWVTASSVRVGDDLVQIQSGVRVAVKVLSTESISKPGLFNPHTIHGDIVVNGILASTYTDVLYPRLAHWMLAPERLFYSVSHGRWTILGKAMEQNTPQLFRWFIHNFHLASR